MNQLTTAKKDIKAILLKEDVKQRFAEMLGKKSNGFLTSVITAITQSEKLSQADPDSILYAAATAASLDLPINPNLGFAYLVPYKGKCQFQMGWKGYIQLCQRTGLFSKINTVPVYEGQLTSENPLMGNTYNWACKESDNITGYVAYFQLNNGYSHELYMTEAQITNHAKRYSQAYRSRPDSLWSTHRVEMAQKTVLKLLLGRFAPMSVDYIQKSITADQSVINSWDGEDVTYVDNERPEININNTARQKELDRLASYLMEAEYPEDLEMLQATVSADPELSEMVQERMDELKEKAKKTVK